MMNDFYLLNLSLIKSLVISLRCQTKKLVIMAKTHKDMTLTRAEMEIMNFLWSREDGRGTVRDVLECYPEPKPAYTTTATFLKILTQKGFVAAEKNPGDGKTFFFRPLITQDEYRKRVMKDVKDSFFGGSATSLVNFFVREEKISESELKELLEMIKEN